MSKSLFNNIAFVYGFFFNRQVSNYHRILEHVKAEFDFSTEQSIIDIGCGTGALCKVLREYGLAVTGVDPAEAMLTIAQKKTGAIKSNESDIRFVHGDVLDRLPFRDKSFDVAVASYLAHGFLPRERLALYQEMKRVAKHTVILLDYNEQRSLITDLLEWLEGGDYLNFIKTVKSEMTSEFGNLEVILTGKRSAMYISRI